MKPKTPKIEKPVEPKKPVEPPAEERIAFRPKGANSFISAGALTQKAFTRKASLLG